MKLALFAAFALIHASCASPAQEASSCHDPLLGKTLVVAGEEVPPLEVMRMVVTGRAGKGLFEASRTWVHLQRELASRGEETPPLELIADGAVLSKSFDRVFLPQDPREYPAPTVKALTVQSEDFVKRLIQGHEAKLESGGSSDPEGQAVFQRLMHELVLSTLDKTVEIRGLTDGLPPEVAWSVGGVEFRTEELWELLRGSITPEDVHEAKLWLASTLSLELDLRERGAWLDTVAFEQAYEAHVNPYRESPFNIEAVALSFKKFPSVEHYRTYFRLRESYRGLIGPELLDDYLLHWHIEDRAGPLLGLAKVDVDVILIPAFDPETQRRDWKQAADSAVACIQDLADGLAWDEALDRYSRWGPDDLTLSRGARIEVERAGGRFRWKNRNELLQDLGESDYSIFLTGSSIADHLFFDAEVGIPTQPLRGPLGYYIAKVKQRTPPMSKINLHDGVDGHRNLVEQDFLSTRLSHYAEAAFHDARVRGL